MDNSNNLPVPVDKAVDMTTNWRDYYGQITGTDPNDAFRAFKIPMEDLRAMVDMASVDQSITSVRAYLALGHDVANGGVIDSDEVHVLLVPVFDSSEAGTDILTVEHDGKTTSTIRDFTRPCPALCDVTSVLYGPQTNKD